MKKLLKLVLGASALTVFLASCSSTKVVISEKSPVAILGVEGNPTILKVDENNETEEDAGGSISNAVNKLIDGSSVEILTAQDRIDYAEESLRRALEELGNMTVIEKEVLLSSDTYKYSNGSLLEFVNTNNVPTGYTKGLLSMGAKKSRMLMSEIGAKSLISAEFEFDKKLIQRASGIHQMSAVVKMRVRFFDEKGSQVISEEFISESDKKTKYINGKYDKQELVDFYPDTIDAVINQFILKYL